MMQNDESEIQAMDEMHAARKKQYEEMGWDLSNKGKFSSQDFWLFEIANRLNDMLYFEQLILIEMRALRDKLE